MKEKVTEELKKHFRPEFLNRIDEIIVFHELTLDEVKQIVDLMLVRVREQLGARPRSGAHRRRQGLPRPPRVTTPSWGHGLRRAIQRMLEDPMSEKFLLGEFKAGSTILVGLDSENEELTFECIGWSNTSRSIPPSSPTSSSPSCGTRGSRDLWPFRTWARPTNLRDAGSFVPYASQTMEEIQRETLSKVVGDLRRTRAGNRRLW
jgi:hypothetical protein